MLVALLAHGKDVYGKCGLSSYVREMNVLQSESGACWEDFAYGKLTVENICGVWLT